MDSLHNSNKNLSTNKSKSSSGIIQISYLIYIIIIKKLLYIIFIYFILIYYILYFIILCMFCYKY